MNGSARKISLRFSRWAATALCLLGGSGASVLAADDSLPARLREHVGSLDAANAQQRDVAAFYALRGYAPAWQDPQRFSALVTALGSTRSDGLDPETYRFSRLAELEAGVRAAETTTDRAVELDLLATDAYLRALNHLHWGKLEPARIDPNYNFEPSPAEREFWFKQIVEAFDNTDVDDAFGRARPQHPVYARLREALQRLRDLETAGGWPAIPDGAPLKPGNVDSRVALLRQRLMLGGYLPAGDPGGDIFDEPLEAALREFQSEQYLDVDGIVGAQTRNALDLPIRARIDQVRVNLERARWLLRQAQGDFVLVDIAGFKVTYFHAGEPAWTARAQVGLPYRSTPSFKSAINAVTFNPTWTVPPTILANDLVPKIRKNPGTLAANRIRVFDRTGAEMQAAAVDWSHPQGLVLRQDAGADNSLGRVAIHFPNPYGVYMHDTPHKELFVEERRAFSSGCIRIEQPLELVERLLAGTPGWERSEIDRLVASGETKTVALGHPVTVLILYWSVDTHNGERIAFKPDIYGKDAALLRALDAPGPAAAPVRVR